LVDGSLSKFDFCSVFEIKRGFKGGRGQFFLKFA